MGEASMGDRTKTMGASLLMFTVSCKGPSHTGNTADAQAAAIAGANDKALAAFHLWDGDEDDAGAKDQPRAQTLFSESCSAGSQVGCTGLAISYLDGVNGTGKDYKKALSLLQPACNGKVARACSALGNMYWDGAGGVPKDENRAVDLYKDACDGGEPRGCLQLGRLYYRGAAGLPKDQPHAFSLFRTACDGGVAEGCYFVATIFELGSGTSKSPTEAVRYATLACQGLKGQQSGDGCWLLANLYDGGEGVPKDRKKAAALASSACDLGSARGCSLHGRMLGLDPANAKRAYEAFQKGCDGDDAEGCYWLATCERHGWGTERSPMAADRSMKKACDLGNATACKEFRR
jgi:uncharacterized protein